MESREVHTQAELDDALRRPDVIPLCAGAGEFRVEGDRFVRAADAARVSVAGAAELEAGGAAVVVATDRTWVTARDRVTVNAHGSAVVAANDNALVRAAERSRVLARGYTSITAIDDVAVVAQGRATVRASHRTRVRALLAARIHLLGEARGWTWGHAMTHAEGRARVTAWGSAAVMASGAAEIEALETAMVLADGAASVRACGAAMVRARGRSQVEAGEGVAVMRHRGGRVEPQAAAQSSKRPASVADWCDYYGVPIADGVAVLYKAVDDDFNSYHGMSYRPGDAPEAPDWDGGEQECGGGLHFSPRPTFALAAPEDEMRFIACPVAVADIVVHAQAVYPDKVKAPRVCAPVYEVDEDGTPVA
jgi:hypothetical protein